VISEPFCRLGAGGSTGSVPQIFRHHDRNDNLGAFCQLEHRRRITPRAQLRNAMFLVEVYGRDKSE
jgi:hypothetical protein